MPTPQGATTRALLDISIGVTKSMQTRQALDAQMGLDELELQFQVKISGTATGTLSWGEVMEIPFDFPLHYAPGQRDSELIRPHFWYGAEIITASPVLVTAVVSDWLTDEDNGATVGAKVRMGVIGASDFEAVVHLTFQGFGSLAEGEAFEDVGDD